MRLCLSHSPSLEQLPRPGRGEMRPQATFRSCLARPPEAQRPKKRVVFADRKGLALASVRWVADAEAGASEGARPASSCPRPAPAGSPGPTACALGLPASGRDSAGRRVPAGSELAPRAARGAGDLPARHRVGARAGFLKAIADPRHL